MHAKLTKHWRIMGWLIITAMQPAHGMFLDDDVACDIQYAWHKPMSDPARACLLQKHERLRGFWVTKPHQWHTFRLPQALPQITREEIYNRDHSAVVVETADGNELIKTSNNHLLYKFADKDLRQFSGSGNIFYHQDFETLPAEFDAEPTLVATIAVVNIETEARFKTIGNIVGFSFDEHVIVTRQYHGSAHNFCYTLFDTNTAQPIAQFYGQRIAISEYTLIMVVSNAQDLILIDMKTGKQIGRNLFGEATLFSPDGKSVAVQQHDGDTPIVMFYSTATALPIGVLRSLTFKETYGHGNEHFTAPWIWDQQRWQRP